jgi:conjugal transfer/type IV secretion protein DotA/TraY
MLNKIVTKIRMLGLLAVLATLPVNASAATCNWDGGVPLGDALTKAVDAGFEFATGGNTSYMQMAGVTSQTLQASLQAGPGGPIFVGLMGTVLGKNVHMLYSEVFNATTDDDAMKRAVKLGGNMIDTAIDSALKAAAAEQVIGLGGKGVSAAAQGIGGFLSWFPGAKGLMGMAAGVVDFLVDQISRWLIFYMGFVVMFITGGALLYFFLPLIPVIAFFSMVLNWFVMILINILGAPIFCFNLIRTDADGLIGRGEKYIADIIRTMITPAVLTIGMVAFLIMFDTLFALLSSFFAYLMPVLLGIYGDSPYIGLVTTVLVLIAFGAMTLYLAQTLATLCTSRAVSTVGAMIGEISHQIGTEMPDRELRGAVSGGGEQITGQTKGLTKAGQKK